MLDFLSWFSAPDRSKEPAFQVFLPPDSGAAPRVLYTGYQHCPPGHAHSGSRPHALLHVVLRGSGTVRLGTRGVGVAAGQAFLFFPNEPFHYRAADDAPWSYAWFGIGGDEAVVWLRMAGMAPDRPVISLGIPAAALTERCAAWFGRLAAAADNPLSLLRVARIGALELFEALDASAVAAGWSRDYALAGASHSARIRQFLEENYSRPLSTTVVARAVYLNRSHCCSLFAAEFGKGIMEWLADFRLKRAAELLVSSDMTLSDVARSVGLGGASRFSRSFARHFGTSPGAWRKSRRAGRW